MKSLRRFATSCGLVARRVRSDLPVTIGVLVAMAALIGVWVGIPLYAESASSRLLEIEVDDASDEGVPFGYLFSYNRLSGGNKSWSDFTPLNSFISGDETPFGPTVRASQRTFTTTGFDLATDDLDDPTVLDTVSFVSLNSFDDTATLSSGRFAQPTINPGDTIEVVVDEAFAESQGLAVDQTFVAINRRAALDDPDRRQTVLITGIWTPPDAVAINGPPDPTLRFLSNGTLTRNLVVPEATISSVIDPLGTGLLSNAQWLVLLDSTVVTTDSVDALLSDTDRINRQVDDRLRGSRSLVSPENSLRGFQEDVASLNRGLALFSLPAIALVIAVLALLVSMKWSRRLNETVLLRRRGVPPLRIIFEALIETVVLGIAAAFLGVVIARLVATFMGRTETFLQLGSGIDLDLVMNTRAWRALLIGTLVAAIIQFLPNLGAFRNRILSISTQTDDVLSQPWWRRTYLDLALVAMIGFFAWFLLRGDALRGDLLEDPIVILLPAATAFGVGLLALRLIPYLMGGIAKLLERTESTALLLVARRTARVSAAMSAPVLLLIITAALAVYTGSLARTLDLQLLDAAHHEVGASNSVTTNDSTTVQLEIVDGLTVPIAGTQPFADSESFDQIWGMQRTSRFAQFTARLEPVDGSSVPVSFTGVDPETFADLAFWRTDYASRSLPDLMGRLRATPDAVLVNRQVAAAAQLRIGDEVLVAVRVGEQSAEMPMVVVGVFEQFPTWNPSDELTPIVGDLRDLEVRLGRNLADQLFFEVDNETNDLAQARADMSRLGIDTSPPRNPDQLVSREQERPERQGIFGLLTVSFVLSAALSIVGFIFYAVFGFTRQLGDLGILRALGLRSRSLSALVIFDLLLVAGLGVGIGAGLGVAMARWYLPQLIDNPVGSAPELLQEIDWSAAVGIPALLGSTLIVITLLLLVVLRRIKLFAAIKLGGNP